MPTQAYTYATLVEDVRKYLERGASAATDPIVFDQIPRFINLAERRIATELKVLGLSNVVTTDLIAGQSVYDKPDRWRENISMNFGAGATHDQRTPLFPRSYEYCRAYWPDESQTDTPLFYADYDFYRWLISPTPDDTYPLEIIYYQLPPLLDDTTQTNWITDLAPQLVLYGALLEAAPFLKNDARIQVWTDMFDRAMAATSGQDLSKILDRSIQRTEN